MKVSVRSSMGNLALTSCHFWWGFLIFINAYVYWSSVFTFIRCAGAHRHISGLLLTHVANAWSIPFPSIRFPLCREMPSLRLPTPSLPVSLLEVAKRFEDGYGRGATRSTAPYHRPAPYPLRSLPLNEPASWNNGGVQGGNYYFDGHDEENFVNKFSLPQLNFEAFPIAQVSVSAKFFNEWTDYNNDSFSGAERRTHHHRSWSRNTRDWKCSPSQMLVPCSDNFLLCGWLGVRKCLAML